MASIFSIVCDILGVALFVLVIGLLGVRGLWYGDPGHARGAGVAVVGAALALFFGNLNSFDTLSASVTGFAAKTREVQTVIDKGEKVVALLRRLAIATASLQVKLLAAEGQPGGQLDRSGPLGPVDKDNQKQQLLSALKDIGVDDDEISKVATADSSSVKQDYVIYILHPLNFLNDRGAQIIYAAAYGNYMSLETPEGCEADLKRFNVYDAKTKELLEDYRYYLKNGKQRRPEVWSQRPYSVAAFPSIDRSNPNSTPMFGLSPF